MDIIGVDDRDKFLDDADDFLARGLYQDALDLAGERLKQCPNDYEARLVICRSQLGMDNLDEAFAVINSLGKTHLRLAGLYKAMGDAFLNRGMKHEAILSFQKAVLLMPDIVEVREIAGIATDTLAIHQEKQPEGVPEEGEDEGEDDDDPAVSPDLYTLTMADLYVRQGHLDMAIEVLESIGRREPDNSAVFDRLEAVRAMISGSPEPPVKKEEQKPGVLGELSRWLDNLDKLRAHGKRNPS
ncbi:MAG: hypothetical protein CSYNP_00199 [Syntrophus sp. SKADARSKE-3]|nr:hypothetical protein [Syntrophus sp. SKADARSKE-3]